ncbi:hypothetical protein D3C73_1108440 [compost metagenome]
MQEDALQPVDHGVDFVLHHQGRGAGQPRGPQDDDLAAQRFLQGFGVAGHAVAVAAVQQVADRRRAVQHALAAHLGRMGGQHRRNQGLGQQVAHGVQTDARPGQTLEHALGRVGPLAGLGLRLGAALACSVLGDIGQQGEGGETVRQTDGLIQRQLAQQTLQLRGVVRRRVAVIGDRRLAHRFDAVVESLSALVADHLAQQGAQKPDLRAEAVVRKFGSLGHGCLSAGRPEAEPYQRNPSAPVHAATQKPFVWWRFDGETESTSPCFSAISRDFRRN